MSKSKRPQPSGKVPPRGGKKGSSNRPSGPPRSAESTGGRPRPAAAAPNGGGGTATRTVTASAGQGAAWERRRKQRQQRNLATIAAAVVVGLVIVLLVVKAVTGSGSAKSTPVPAAVAQQVTGVTVADMVSAAQSAPNGAVIGLPAAIKAPALGAGKPMVLYVGAEYCPYCAAERWPLVMALSKFGSFANLGSTTSSSTDANPNTPTLSFHGSTFTSQYLDFVGVEQQDRKGGTLEKLTPFQSGVLKKYDASPYVSSQSAGSIPFIDFNGKLVLSGASYDSSALANLSIQRASEILTTPVSGQAAGASKQAATSLAAQAVAGHLLGALCVATDNRPPVCSQVPAGLKQGGGPVSGKTSK